MKNRRILVTGASRGIGLKIAQHLAQKGAELILLAGSEESIISLKKMQFVQESGAVTHVLDLSNQQAIIDFTESWRGELWGIVNNAGICKTLNLKDTGDDPLEEVLNTNLIGPYMLTKRMLPYLSRPGRIVNIASQLGQEGRSGYSAYCASKFGLIGMTKCWAKELGSEGITVNAVCPGWVDTEMSKIDMQRMANEQGVKVDHFYAEICEPLELKRFNSTDEVANLVSFLLSDSASGITGRDWLMQTVWNQS
jgi:NAD(P)-dependent dehydrogenase (short-subunit alcohol dehydrogenase family)